VEVELSPFIETIRTKLVAQQALMFRYARQLSRTYGRRGDPRILSLIASLRRQGATIRKEITRSIETLPPVVLQGCPTTCDDVVVQYDLTEVESLTIISKRFLSLARKAINARNALTGAARRCDAACRARVIQRRREAAVELRYARELSRETVTIIRGTPRIVLPAVLAE